MIECQFNVEYEQSGSINTTFFHCKKNCPPQAISPG